MDDLQSNLESYYLQLQQVNAALTTDPTNEELLKLKTDLQEVIDLTKELLVQQSSSSSSYGDEWKVGDKCLSLWSNDGRYYEAIIEEIHPDGKVSVGIPELSQGEMSHVSLLKRLETPKYSSHPSSSKGGGPSSSSTGNSSSMKRVSTKETFAERKQALLKQKEYLKKRKQKKQARVQEQEAEREKVKKKWINFSTKKGLMNKKKSIFASPETVDGRVGVGTCGVSGKGMTGFSQADKWRKGWTRQNK